MINISNRLLSITSLIDNDENVVDVGCDHGLLDVYLTLNKNCKCRAIDVSRQIIDRARTNFLKYGVLDKIDLFVGNGFDDLKIDISSTIILAGMGTSTILRILEKNRTSKIICQTNTDLYVLRKTVCDMGYYIVDEDIVFENNRYYITIKFSLGNKNYCYDDYLLGPILRIKKTSLFNDYVNNLFKKNINGYYKALEFNSDSCSDLELMINCLKKYI